MAARSIRAWHASAVNGVSSDGFHTTVSPHTNAMAVFHDHTATGKLNAVITPTTPRGCQVSISRWPGRSDAMVLPYSCRDSPTANWQMSIISCTSPSASEVILPASIVTSVARSALCSTSSSPSRATRAPRAGAGVVRHVRERLGGRGDRGIGLLGCGLGDGEQHVAGDRGAGRQPVAAGFTELGT